MNQLHKDIIRLRKQFLTYREIAEELGCSYTLPHKVLKKYVPRLMKNLTTVKVKQNLSKIIKFRKAGITYKEIGSQLGLPKSAVERAVSLYAPELIHKPITGEEREQKKQEVVELQRQGLKNREVAKKLGLTKGTVDTYLSEARMEGVELLVKRKSYPKLSQQQMEERDREIARLYEEGVQPEEIANMFDIVIPRVYQVVWKEKPEINIKKREDRKKRDRKIVKMMESGFSPQETSEKLRVSVSTVYSVIRKNREEQ